MKKLKMVFLFMRDGASETCEKKWSPTGPCDTKYHSSFHREGYFTLLQQLMDADVLDSLNIFYESNRGPGRAEWVNHPKAKCTVVPHIEIDMVCDAIDKDTLIWVRGGFKPWHDFLVQYKGKNWLMLYGANTGRERWKWWDIILDDLGMQSKLDENERVWAPFFKPIDDTFYKPKMLKPKYDICVGASHIHDRKGQWRIQGVLNRFKGRKLNIIVPGSTRKSAKTRDFINWAHCQNQHTFTFPGHVHKTELVDIYNQSKVVAFLGAHGQNDRGPLEAMACGCRVIIGSPRYHTNALRGMESRHLHLCMDVDNYDSIAAQSMIMIDAVHSGGLWLETKETIAKEFRKNLGSKKALNEMCSLLTMVKYFPPTKEYKKKVARILGGDR